MLEDRATHLEVDRTGGRGRRTGDKETRRQGDKETQPLDLEDDDVDDE
jgi:hypothetical protein